MPTDTTTATASLTDPITIDLYINGTWQQSESGDRREATAPSTGQTIATVPDGTRADVKRAIAAAADVASDLEFMTAFERAELCRELGETIEDNAEWLAEWLTVDQGKPLHEAKTEVEFCADEFFDAAGNIERLGTEVIPSKDPNKRIFTIRKPRGVYGVITPWNYPLNIPAEYLAPGLASGNAIIWVPAPSTSVVAAKLVELFDEETSLPPGALSLVTGEGPVVGNELVVNEDVDAIGFTGSPETGEAIARDAGIKPTLLELGGNGPVIVLDDADLDAAAEATAFGSYTNAGQICSASERILVHEAVKDDFVEKLHAITESIALGDPLEDHTDMGPLNNEGVAAKMDRHIEDAVSKGAEIVAGGSRADDRPSDLFYEPTILEGVSTDMVINTEETFGPIAPIITFDEYDEAIEITNGIDLGLTSSVFTSDLALANYFIERVETGLINVNDSSAYWEIHTPFGGHSGKRSGTGRLGGTYTIEQMTQIKNISIDYSNVESPLTR